MIPLMHMHFLGKIISNLINYTVEDGISSLASYFTLHDMPIPPRVVMKEIV